MIYTKPVNDITWKEIEDFCTQQIPEGANLDYKKDFPVELEKTIASFANTIGGIILIGIEQNDDNTPKLPIAGIKNDRGLSERVMNIILSNITPPLMPDIGVIPNHNNSNAVVLIRIPQSHQTPHAISNNTRIYLRTGDRNYPEELANIGKVEWLLEGRKKSLNFKKLLLTYANNRFNNFYKLTKNKLGSNQNLIGKISKGWFTLTLNPVYPKDMLITPAEIIKIKSKIEVKDYYNTDIVYTIFPLQSNGIIVQDGAVFESLFNNKLFYTQLGSYGMYYYKQSLVDETEWVEEKTIKFIRATEIFIRIDEFIDSALKFYKELGYFGYLQFDVQLDKISKQQLGLYPSQILKVSKDSKVSYTTHYNSIH